MLDRQLNTPTSGPWDARRAIYISVDHTAVRCRIALLTLHFIMQRTVVKSLPSVQVRHEAVRRFRLPGLGIGSPLLNRCMLQVSNYPCMAETDPNYWHAVNDRMQHFTRSEVSRVA